MPEPARTTAPILEVSDLKSGYGHVEVLHGVSLAIAERDRAGLPDAIERGGCGPGGCRDEPGAGDAEREHRGANQAGSRHG